MNMRSKLLTTMAVVFLIHGGLSPVVLGGTITFVNDYEGFLAAAGAVQTIDFETLPDGSPSLPGTMITPDFNYTNQGVAFSSPVPELYLAGNPVSGFTLSAYSYPEFFRNWIVADFAVPVSAVGIFFGGQNVLSVFAENDELIASIQSSPSMADYRFLGVVSDEYLVTATIDANSSLTSITELHFAPIPEPSVLLLMIAGAFVIARKLPNREPR